MDYAEGVGESSSPPRSYGSFGGGGTCGGGNDLIREDVYNRLVENGNEEAIGNPDFRELLEAHFNRLPPSYGLDINMDRVEDVLLHQKLLASAKDLYNQPVFHIRFLENVYTRSDDFDGEPVPGFPLVSLPPDTVDSGAQSLQDRNFGGEFETCSRFEDLDLDVRKNSNEMNNRTSAEDPILMQEQLHTPVHEVIFSTLDKPKLLSQLSALLSDIGLNIREAHVFSTTDGYSLDVFVVDGWCAEDTEGLCEAVKKGIVGCEGLWSGSPVCRSITERIVAEKTKHEGWEISWRSLKIGGKIASGSCGDLYRGLYLGEDVAIKILRSEHLNNSIEAEFTLEVDILRQLQHDNVVHFIGACTKLPHLCIVTEYMPGGSLYEYLHKNHHHVVKLPQLLKFAIDICRGMEYLHQKNVIHRDLKTANLLMDTHNVVKVADFGVARFQNKGGVMTAETGTYRWMAPEVINHQPYDQKADVFSFAIVLWELLTAKIPYNTMTPLQAALGVRQGLRPELPKSVHPKLLSLMQRCWAALPSNRPSFSIILVELEELLQEVKGTRNAQPDGC